MMYASIEDLRSQLGPASAADNPVYAEKMLHALPEAQTVDRVAFILKHCTGKRVLEFGASGPMTEKIRDVAAEYLGVDRTASMGVLGYDLDATDALHSALPYYGPSEIRTPDVIVCGEVLEHLGNPLHFLERLRRQYTGVPLIVTVPNAFSAAARDWLAKGFENVNKDHVAWYSPKTISVLLERAGYQVGALYYYNGVGPTAEGLIVATE